MDGTLLNSCHEISSRSINAIRSIQSKGKYFIPATGRHRSSVIAATGSSFLGLYGGTLDSLPGIFSQGLVVYNMKGDLIHEEHIEYGTIKEIEQFCKANSVSLIAYTREKTYTPEYTDHILAITKLKDVLPDLVPIQEYDGGYRSVSSLEKLNLKVNKLILLSDEHQILQHRPILEKKFRGHLTLTRAMPGMLEVLPFGSSKGKGVLKFLEHHSIHPSHAMAFGDAENDIEMLQYVRYGIAMNNAKVEVQRTAFRKTVTTNAEDGVAHELEKML
jgi:Cof subfamily protein (haloacid dehalogenase superfamily)